MARPTDRRSFKEYCLRKLGKPVVEINVDDDQVEDRIDEALSYYWDYHFDGTEKVYLKHQVTAEDKENGYIIIPENINGAVNVFPIGGSSLGEGEFSAKYQFMLNNLEDLGGTNMTHFHMAMTHATMIDQMLVGTQPIRYNRHTNKLYIDARWKDIREGSYIIVEAYEVIDPEIYSDVWKDRWLLDYATALIKMQWGVNITKFSGMTLPGNVQFNGEFIYNEAKEEIQKLEQDMIFSYSLPVNDFLV